MQVIELFTIIKLEYVMLLTIGKGENGRLSTLALLVRINNGIRSGLEAKA